MKNFKDAFTYIELLVVISIIVISSISGTMYFSDFLDKQELNQKISLIKNKISTLDKDIINYKIFDYELHFNTSTGSKGFISYKNNFDLISNQTINLDTNTYTGTISSIGSGTGITQIYKRHKLFIVKSRTGSIDYEYGFNDVSNYKITGTLSGEILNDINIDYFSDANVIKNGNDYLELININTKTDKTGTNYNSLVIINIGGKKEVLGNGTDPINKVYLFFENRGKESWLEIEK